MTRAALIAALALGGLGCRREQRAAPEGLAPAASSAGAPSSATACERVFVVEGTSGPAAPWVLGTLGNALWATTPDKPLGPVRWRREGAGVVQAVAAGDIGRGPRIYVAWGRGRGHLDAPIVLDEIDPERGDVVELWRFAGERSEVTHLSVSDVTRDGEPDLAFAYYASKYMVRTRHLTSRGEVLEGPPVRMATSRAYADLDGDGTLDEIVGRLYGDTQTAPGDLTVHLARGAVSVPTDRGVRAVLVTQLHDDATPALYFADGWTANYAREAKAQLARARWDGAGFVVEHVAASPDEFMFSELRAIDLDGDGALEVIAHGSARVSVLAPAARGAWTVAPLHPYEGLAAAGFYTDAEGTSWALLPGNALRALPLSSRPPRALRQP